MKKYIGIHFCWWIGISFFFLTSCGGSSGGGGNGTSQQETTNPSVVEESTPNVVVSGTVIDGPIANATVQIRSLTSGELISDATAITAQTNSSGEFRLEFPLPEDQDSDLWILESAGGTDTGANATFGDADDLSGLSLSAPFIINSGSNVELLVTPLSTLVAYQLTSTGLSSSQSPQQQLDSAQESVASQVDLTIDQLNFNPMVDEEVSQVTQSIATLVRMLEALQTASNEARIAQTDEVVGSLWSALATSPEPILQRTTEGESPVLQSDALIAALETQVTDPTLLVKSEAIITSSVENITLLAEQSARQITSTEPGEKNQSQTAMTVGIQSLLNSAEVLRDTPVEDAEADRGKLQVITQVLNSAAQSSITQITQSAPEDFQDTNTQQELLSSAQVSSEEFTHIVDLVVPFFEDATSIFSQAANEIRSGTTQADSVVSLQLSAVTDAVVEVTTQNDPVNSSDLTQASEIVAVANDLIVAVIDQEFIDDVNSQVDGQSNDALAGNKSLVLNASAVAASKNVLSVVQTIAQDPEEFETLKTEASAQTGTTVENTVALSQTAVNQLVTVIAEDDSSSALLNDPGAVSQLTKSANVANQVTQSGNGVSTLTQPIATETIDAAKDQINSSLQETKTAIQQLAEPASVVHSFQNSEKRPNSKRIPTQLLNRC